jgi:glutamate-1-semialdehyde aminotransferase
VGVPKNLEGTSIPFHYNDIDELNRIMTMNSGEVAAIIMEPIGSYSPDAGFLESVRELATKNGAVLIFDEISSGFRINNGGAHLELGVDPDIAIFSKAISNGYPMGVVLGKSHIMEMAQDSFISSTSWTEGIGPVAAIATMTKFADTNAHEHLIKIGNKISDGWKEAAIKANLEVKVSGLPSLLKFSFNHPEDLAMKTYFTQEMLDAGYLASGRFYAMLSHTMETTELYVQEASRIFLEISELLRTNSLSSKLKGDVAHSGFQRLN